MALAEFGRGPAEAGQHGGEIVAPIEAVLELRQVAGDVLLTDGPVGGGDGRRGDPLEGGGSTALRRNPVKDRMPSRIRDTAEAAEAVADDGAGGIEAAPGPVFRPAIRGSITLQFGAPSWTRIEPCVWRRSPHFGNFLKRSGPSHSPHRSPSRPLANGSDTFRCCPPWYRASCSCNRWHSSAVRRCARTGRRRGSVPFQAHGEIEQRREHLRHPVR